MQTIKHQTTRQFVAKSLRAWRFPVFAAHAASLILGCVTGALGVVNGPAMQALFLQSREIIPWKNVIGPIAANALADYLPQPGLDPESLFATLPALLLIIATVKALMTFFQWYTWEWLGERLAWRWRSEVAQGFTNVSCEARDDGKIQDQENELGGAVAQDIRSLREYVVHFYGGLPREGLQVVFTAITLLLLSPKLFGIFVCCVAPVGALLSRFGRRIRKRASRALKDNSSLTEWIQQRLLGIETIKHYRSEDKESLSMIAASHNLFRRYLAAVRLKSRTSPMIEIFGVAAMSVALWVAFSDIAKGAISGSIVMSFFASLALFAQAAAKLGRYLNSNQEGKAAGDRLVSLLESMAVHVDHDPQTGNRPPALNFAPGSTNAIHLQQISLGYESGEGLAVKDFSYKFEGGKVYCLVGTSGAGKSTLFNAMLGLRRPTAGTLHATVSPQWQDRSLDLVSLPQTVPTVPTTLARNVSYPHIEADSARVTEALAKVHFVIEEDRLPNGVQSFVGPGHLQLSGGQAQRLQLARLVYHRAPFVLVDEGTSALDPVTESQVLQTLKYIAKQGSCVIMIAHRRAAAEASDQILVLDHGQLIAVGPPHQILTSTIAQRIFGV